MNFVLVQVFRLFAMTTFAFATPAFAAGALNVGVQLEPPNLDPTSGAAAAIDEIVYANIFEGLTRINDNGTVTPALAESWTVSDDGLTYRFELHRDIHFHDGGKFDANDVVFSLTRAGAKSSTNAQRLIFEKIATVTAPNSHTVVLTLSEPLAELLTYLAWGDAVIVSAETAATNVRTPIGTGPFKFVRWRKGASITLNRNDDYWGVRPPLEQINFIFVPDPTAAFAALMAGDVDGFPNYPAAENLALIERDERFKIIEGFAEGEMIVAINNRKTPFKNLNVRRAIAHAIDRRAVIEAGLFGFGTPIGSHFPPNHPAYVDIADRYPYDPTLARRLLKDAGYGNGLALVLTLPPPAYARRGGEVVAAYLEAVGVEVTIRNVEWSQWLDQVFANNNFDLTIVSHTEPLDIDIYARPEYYFGYANPVLSALIDEIRKQPDDTIRNGLYAKAQRIIADDTPNIFIASSPKVGVWRREISNVWSNAPVQANDFTKTDIPGRQPLNVDGDITNQFQASAILPLLIVVLIGALAWLGHASIGFLAAKFISMAFTMAAASILVFAIIEIAPGDPAAFMMGLNADPQSLAALRTELGLDQAISTRYLRWIAGLAIGDFGTSYTYRVPVAELIAERMWVTLPLAVFAFMLSTIVGIVAGITATLWRERLFGKMIKTFSQMGVAIPNFWFAILLVIVFAVGLQWFSAGGFPGWGAGLLPALKALLLPAIALAAPQAAILTQIMRSSLTNVAGADYIRTARAKGLTNREAIIKHGLRNALVPVLTILGLQFAFLIAGSIIVENVFYLPGLGRMIFQSIAQRDLIVVKGVVICLIFSVILINFLVDLAYPVVDPRLRRRV